MFWNASRKIPEQKVITMVGGLLVSLLLSSAALSDHSFSKYEDTFKIATFTYMPEYDYLWLVAQCKQESNFDEFAISPAGAEGYCQFMSGTWFDCQLTLGFVAPRSNARKNITCAAWYMGHRIAVWRGRDRTAEERLPLGQASYNCGTGCVLAAQRRCENARLFEQLIPCLPRETQEYPPRIEVHNKRFLEEREHIVPSPETSAIEPIEEK